MFSSAADDSINMRLRRAARTILNNLEESVAGAGLVFVVAVTIYTIANRYILEGSGVWAPEVAGIVFAWVVFLGVSAAWKRNMHISINVVVRLLSPRVQKLIGILGDLVLIAFFAYVSYLAIRITVSAHSRVSPVLRIPFSYVYASVAVSFMLMLSRQIIGLARAMGRGAEAGGR